MSASELLRVLLRGHASCGPVDLRWPELTLDALGDRQQDACNERLAVMRLLEDLDLFAETGPGPRYGGLALRYFEAAKHGGQGAESLLARGSAVGGGGVKVTYVPGFWSVKGLNSTVLTSIFSDRVGCSCSRASYSEKAV